MIKAVKGGVRGQRRRIGLPFLHRHDYIEVPDRSADEYTEALGIASVEVDLRIVKRQYAGGERELDSARGTARHYVAVLDVAFEAEVLYLGAYLGRRLLGVAQRDRAKAVLPVRERRPEVVAAAADGAHRADTRNDDVRSHVAQRQRIEIGVVPLPSCCHR